MALYKAYGELTSGGSARTPFLVDIVGTTPVALVEGTTEPDLEITLEVTPLAENGGTGSGLGLRAFLAPVAGRVLTDLFLRIVVLPNGQALAQGTEPDPGLTDFVAIEYATTGSRPMPPLVVTEVGRLTRVTTNLAPAMSITPVAPDNRLDDEIVVEACIPGSTEPLNLGGGLVTGEMIVFPGRLIDPTGPYAEHPTSIRGIDLSRVEDSPPDDATSPTSATWFEIAASASTGFTTKPGSTPQTHLTVTVRQPHQGSAPDAPLTAVIGPDLGPMMPGTYEYRVAFAHANGNESALGPPSAPVEVTNSSGTALLSDIPEGTASNDPDVAVIARRIYRRGPGGGDDHLVGQLPGLAAAGAPAPLPTTFTDQGDVIDVGNGQQLATDTNRPPSRISIRYGADISLDLSGFVRLVSAGPGPTGVDTFGGHIDHAPTDLLVTNDDRTELRGDLSGYTVARSRLRWEANEPTRRLDLAMPSISSGVTVRIDAMAPTVGLDWRLDGDKQTRVDLRGQSELIDLFDPAPGVGNGGPTAIGRVALKLGPGAPAPAWPEGEATVGIDIVDGTTNDHTAVAARGLRWVRLTTGDGVVHPLPPPTPDDLHPRAESHLRANVLLGADPSNPPGGERTLRLLRRAFTADHQGDSRLWGRVGVLPDQVSIQVDVVPHPDQPDTGDQIEAVIRGSLGRVVASLLPDSAGTVGRRPGSVIVAPAKDRTKKLWLSLDTIGRPTPLGPPEVRVSANGRDIDVQLTTPVQVEAAAQHLDVGDRDADVFAQFRLPSHLSLHLGKDDQSLLLGPDGAWGRAAVAWSGHPVAARANPQLRLRHRPPAPDGESLEAVTGRVLGFTSASLDVSPSSPVRDINNDLIDPVAKTSAAISFTGPRPNRSLRFEAVEIDPRFQPLPRTAWRARIGELPDSVAAEIHRSDEEGGGLFLARTTTSTPITGGVVWGEPLQIRPADNPRPELAGVGNVAALISELPTILEIADLSGIPTSQLGQFGYPSADELVPREHTPSTPNAPGGVRIRVGGRLAVGNIRIASFDGDEDFCVDDHIPYNRSHWSETIVPFAHISLDPDVQPSTEPDDTTVWLWSYTAPPPPAPDPGPPPNPCDDPPDGPDLTEGKAFRIGKGLVVDLAMRGYKLTDSVGNTFAVWNQMLEPWLFDQDLQMKAFRGEITIVDPPGKLEALGNPYGDWYGDTGDWYLRANGKLKIVSTNDLYMGNTDGGYPVPFSNGLFSTLEAIYNITWP